MYGILHIIKLVESEIEFHFTWIRRKMDFFGFGGAIKNGRC